MEDQAPSEEGGKDNGQEHDPRLPFRIPDAVAQTVLRFWYAKDAKTLPDEESLRAALLQRVDDDVASLRALTADVSDEARRPLRRASLRTLPSSLAEVEAGVRRVTPLAPRTVAECRALIAMDDEIMRDSLFGSRVAAALERRDWWGRDA